MTAEDEPSREAFMSAEDFCEKNREQYGDFSTLDKVYEFAEAYAQARLSTEAVPSEDNYVGWAHYTGKSIVFCLGYCCRYACGVIEVLEEHVLRQVIFPDAPKKKPKAEKPEN